LLARLPSEILIHAEFISEKLLSKIWRYISFQATKISPDLKLHPKNPLPAEAVNWLRSEKKTTDRFDF